MKIKIPSWAIPVEIMNDEDLRFAIEAADIIDFMQRGFTKEDHIACYKAEFHGQAGKDWDEVVSRLAKEKHR